METGNFKLFTIVEPVRYDPISSLKCQHGLKLHSVVLVMLGELVLMDMRGEHCFPAVVAGA